MDRLTPLARFESPAVELSYRDYHRRQERWQAWLTYAATVATSLLFIPSDRVVLGAGSPFWFLFYLRVATIVYACVALSVVHRVSHATADRMLVGWAAYGAVVAVAVGSSRPPQYFLGFVISQFFLFLLLYFVAPVPLLWQSGIAIVFTIAEGYLTFARHPELNTLALHAIVVTFMFTNVIGTAVSWNLNRLKRQQFAALQRETALRAAVEQTLAENKTLRGILPICSYCKSVRTDEGYWQQVEEYVRDRSEAEFSHGICPKCLKEHFDP